MISSDILRNKAVFFGLTGGQLERIASVAEERSFAKGDVVFRQGDPGDALFIVEKGGVEIYVEKEGKEGAPPVSLASLGPGAVFGEVTLVNVEPRSATAVAAGEPTLLLEIKHAAISGIFREDQELLVSVLLNLTRILSKRLRMTDQRFLYTHGAQG